MASTIEEIEEAIQQAISADFRGRLLDRGLARSMIWIDGELPEGSPTFAKRLSYDLLSYGYSLLSLALRLKELEGNADLYRVAFEKSATAITDVMHNGNPNDLEKGFHKVLAASAYHLGHFSAKAFSLIHQNIEDDNLSPMEKILSLLMLRKLEEIDTIILKWKTDGSGSDETLAKKLDTEIDLFHDKVNTGNNVEEIGITSIELPIIDLALTDNYYSSIFEFLFALETGDQQLFNNSIDRINNSLSASADLNMVPQWWILRITKSLLDDLWNSSFHQVIPLTPDQPHSDNWALHRWLFITSLYKRKKAEIDLWPSQLEAGKRAVNDTDDLVVSLPTSAGKTRVAELCILRSLAIGKRVLFITPLRALSAQTESSLRKTFLPLGKSVSSLYGSMGTSDFEQDILKTQDIVVGTPEKLDFALRNDPSILDDVGLVVLDEGHMIGLNEREISYEVQIQRLLKRHDATQRRIVCLSAILPSGDQFDDFVNWLRQDKDGEAIQSNWRPTDLRFGEVIWKEDVGRLNFSIGEERPFVPGYIQPMIPSLPNPGIRTTVFPKDAKELTLATAWRLIQDDHTVLIYCPEKRSVNGFAKDIIDLHKRGAITSVLSVSLEKLQLAIVLGEEWLGEGHPIVECLKIGVAVHHGSLPTPFRKEIENLLREGVLKVTVSSPTLAQGLNLTATAVIMHSIHRHGEIIDASEFKNVIGRAGRAFIDTHGLVLRPIFNKYAKQGRQWRNLVEDTNARNMESGLVLLVLSLIESMIQSIGSNDTDDLFEYVINHNQTWNLPNIVDEEITQKEEEQKVWDKHIRTMDTALLSMLGEEEITTTDISDMLNTILQSSLWERRLHRRSDEVKAVFDLMLTQRAKYIWNETTPLQRKGYFLAGVGLETGQHLDAISQQANLLLINANIDIINNNQESAITSIIQLAELVFSIVPFTPKDLPDDWKEILSSWLKGKVLTECNFQDINEALQFIEDGLIYRLPWGLEAIRVRALANEDVILDGRTMGDYEVGLLVPSIENGTLNRSVALLMQAGFNSRKAAIHAVHSTNASFSNSRELSLWLESDEIINLTNRRIWPTPETSALWIKFTSEYKPLHETTWISVNNTTRVSWLANHNLVTGSLVRLFNNISGQTQVLSPDGEKIGQLYLRYNLLKTGVYYTVISEDINNLDVVFWGTGNNPFQVIN